jgi:HEAT repeat protein
MDIADLFAQTLSGEYDNEAPWHAVHALQSIGTREVLEKAAGWCHSEDPLQRARGADVLGQLGKSAKHPSNRFPEACFAILADLAAKEEVSQPLSFAIHGLGHVGNPGAVPIIIRHSAHADPDVRFAVACACGNFGNEPLAVGTLLLLMCDEDSEVRDWATFGLGSLSELDTQSIRDGLLAALDDPDEDVRQEALVGLARRRDRRVLPLLFRQLESPQVDDMTIEAACQMLEIADGPPDWKKEEYVIALRNRFDQANAGAK